MTFFSFSTYLPVNVTTLRTFRSESDDVHTESARKVAVVTTGKAVLEVMSGEHCFGRELCAREIDVRAVAGELPNGRYDVVVEHNSESLDFGRQLLLDVGEIAGLLGKRHGLEMQVKFARGHRDNRRNVILWLKAPGRAEAR